MATASLMNPVVKVAIDAFQRGDRATWTSLFAPDAELFDDGNTRSLSTYSEEAVGHERFTSIERVDNKGLDVVGQFHSDQWGDFRTYFRFELSAEGKISCLRIGQA